MSKTIGVFARRYIMATRPSWMERHMRMARPSFRERREADDRDDWRVRCLGFKIRNRPNEAGPLKI
jgi:hypothetical protein